MIPDLPDPHGKLTRRERATPCHLGENPLEQLRLLLPETGNATPHRIGARPDLLLLPPKQRLMADRKNRGLVGPVLEQFTIGLHSAEKVTWMTAEPGKQRKFLAAR